MAYTLQNTIDWSSCTRCGLHKTRSQVVWGTGRIPAKLLILGEMPGRNEDAQGKPFIGRAGKLLDELLEGAGITRTDCWITNTVLCWAGRNREPWVEEQKACAPWLLQQLEAAQPKAILALGRCAVRMLLKTETPLMRLRKKIHRTQAGRSVIVSYHPAYILRNPDDRVKVEEDLKFLRANVEL